MTYQYLGPDLETPTLTQIIDGWVVTTGSRNEIDEVEL